MVNRGYAKFLCGNYSGKLTGRRFRQTANAGNQFSPLINPAALSATKAPDPGLNTGAESKSKDSGLRLPPEWQWWAAIESKDASMRQSNCHPWRLDTCFHTGIAD